MEKYKNLASLIFNQPLLCTPEYAETILAVVGDKFDIKAGDFEIRNEERDKREISLRGDGTYVIPIVGAMTHRASFLDAMSGMQSYQSIQGNIQSALDNPKVKSILLELDTPGGSVAGAFDLHDFIKSASEQKPIYALAKDSACSAGYLLGAACTKFYTTQTGEVGSIGVVATLMDRTEKNKAQGVKPVIVKAGKFKTTGNPDEKISKEGMEYLQSRIDDSYDLFVKAVADARNLDEEAIRETEARVYRGEKAVSVGLADGIRTFDATIEELAKSAPRVNLTTSIKPKGMKMDKEEMEKLQADYAQAQATVDTLKQENETLRGVVIKEGYKISAEGITKNSDPEMIEVAGVMTDKASLPAHVLEALEASALEKETAKLEKEAVENFPHFAKDQAVALVLSLIHI